WRSSALAQLGAGVGSLEVPAPPVDHCGDGLGDRDLRLRSRLLLQAAAGADDQGRVGLANQGRVDLHLDREPAPRRHAIYQFLDLQCLAGAEVVGAGQLALDHRDVRLGAVPDVGEVAGGRDITYRHLEPFLTAQLGRGDLAGKARGDELRRLTGADLVEGADHAGADAV